MTKAGAMKKKSAKNGAMGIQKRWKSGQEKEFNFAGIWEGEGGI